MTSHLDLGGPREPGTGPLPVTAPAVPPPAPPELVAPLIDRPAAPERAPWETAYGRAAVATDVAAVLLTVAIGHVLGLGTDAPAFGGPISPGLGLAVGALTLICLFLTRVWDPQVLGQGPEELNRLGRGFVAAALVLSLVGLALGLPAVRPWVFGLLPLAGVTALAARFALRKTLHRKRFRGKCLHEVLAVGPVETVADLARRTRRARHVGWVVTGACTPTGTGREGAPDIDGVPVLGDLDAVADVARRREHRVVAVARTPGWTPRRLHQLAWDLEGLGSELVVDPGLMEVAGPRLHVAPVDGLLLLRLTQPTFSGSTRVLKSVIDRVGAAVLLLMVAPLLLAVAVAVRCDGGPALFRQRRVGRHGRTFTMLKFRSMVVDAEARRAELLARDEGAGPLFKMRADPRITRVGTLLRRTSLDELPQLINVVTGSMSLVGPRPPLPAEVATYSRDAARRLLVKPGLTGLWQVSGRSDLTWEESVRLDLRYVENWSLAADALIVWKTIGALVRGTGAY